MELKLCAVLVIILSIRNSNALDIRATIQNVNAQILGNFQIITELFKNTLITDLNVVTEQISAISSTATKTIDLTFKKVATSLTTLVGDNDNCIKSKFETLNQIVQDGVEAIAVCPTNTTDSARNTIDKTMTAVQLSSEKVSIGIHAVLNCEADVYCLVYEEMLFVIEAGRALVAIAKDVAVGIFLVATLREYINTCTQIEVLLTTNKIVAAGAEKCALQQVE